MKKILLLFVSILGSFHLLSQEVEYSRYAVKYAPFQLIAGELHFEFEHAVAPQISVFANAGPTISDVGLGKLLLDEIYKPSFSRESDIGAFIGIGFRYYILSNYAMAPKGLYVGPEIKYRYYKSTPSTDPSQMQQNTNDLYYNAKQLSFRFQIGNQFLIGGRFALDMYVNFGMGKTTINTRDMITYYDGANYVYGMGDVTRNKVSIVGTTGIKFGFGGIKK